jgi:hypothetical protein
VKIGVALALLAVFAWGLFTWLFFNPFEGRFDRIDRVIPVSVGVAFRGSATDVLESPFVKGRILARKDVEETLSAWGLEDGLRRLREEQDRMNARLPAFLGGFDFQRDLAGSETVAFGTLRVGKEGPILPRMALATRLTFKARMALSVLKHGWARARVEAQSSVKIQRYPTFYEIDASASGVDRAWRTCFAALVKDLLIFGNDRDLVAEAARLAEAGGGGSLPDRPDAGIAFSKDSTAPLRGWMDVARHSADRTDAKQPTLAEAMDGEGGLAAILGMLLDPGATATVQAVVGFPTGTEALLEVTGVRNDIPLPPLPEGLAAGASRPAAEALKEAAILAPAGSAVAALRVEAPVGAMLRAFYGRLGPDVRGEIEKALVDEKTSLDDLAREFDEYLQPGASIVVERLPDCDALSLDRYGADAQGEFVLPLPGYLLVLRQRGSAGDGATERMVRRRLEGWRARLSVFEDMTGLPAGVRGFRFRPKFLTGERRLIQPAAAFEGDLVFLASNEGTLRRALEAREGKAPALSDYEGFEAAAARCGEGQAAAFIEMGAARKMRRDDRREAATRMVERDWVAERKRIFTDVATKAFQGQQVVDQAKVEEEVERRMEQAQKDAREVDFPRAIEKYLQSLQAYEELRSISACLAWDGSGFRLAVSIRTPE